MSLKRFLSELGYYSLPLDGLLQRDTGNHGAVGRTERRESVGDLVKALPRRTNIEFDPLGSTTFKREDMDAGVEPDECFYIQNRELLQSRKNRRK